MGCGILVIRKRDHRIIFSNRVAQNILGYSEDELSRMVFDELTTNVKTIKKLNSGSIKCLETTLKTSLGDIRYVRCNTSEMVYGAEVVSQFTFMDITQEKRNREEIAFQWNFLDNAEEIAMALDKEGKIVYLNQFAAKSHGYELEEMLGTPERLYLKFTEKELEEQKNILRKNKRWEGDEWRIKRNGSLFITSTKRTLIETELGKLELVVAMDVTERRKLQEKLELHSLILKNVREVAFALDINGRLIYMNEAAERFFKVEFDSVYGLQAEDIKPKLLKNFITLVWKKKEITDNELLEVVDEKGTKILIEYSSQIVKNVQGEEIAVVFAIRTNEHLNKLLGELLRKSDLLYHMQQMLVAVDLEGRIIYANNQWLKHNGFTDLSEVHGKKISTQFREDNFERKKSCKEGNL